MSDLESLAVLHTPVRGLGSRARELHRCARAPRAGPAATLPAQQQAGAVSGPNYVTVDRNLAMELVRVTEAAALAGGAWLGKVPPPALPARSHTNMPGAPCEGCLIRQHI